MISGELIVVLISTTAFPDWAATLITADSSVRLCVRGASGATTAVPEGVSLMNRGASRMVAAEPTRPPTIALISTVPRMPIRRRGCAGFSTGRGGRGGGSGGGGGEWGSLAIELSPILRSNLSATGQRKPRKDQLLGPAESCLLVEAHRLRVVLASPDGGKRDVSLTKQFHGVAKEAPADPLGPEGDIDGDLGDLCLEAGAWIEEHAPAASTA